MTEETAPGRCFGDLIESYSVGRVQVQVKYGCVRRDQYDMRVPPPLPSALRAELARRGSVRGGDALYVVEIEGVHQVTVAPAQGRVVVMPRMGCERDAQRAAADELARTLDALAGP